ncbi:hypothetical protein [Thermococcus sp. JdF3]|uniref:hypothetical protein n=1 Tax=Thermococcus sp. JdF3 TaxID=1638258 RepID=UPI001439C070|nr:hypothetical protein [Thermococcus sp. JdF3]NJE01830.1 hypothetical protein [Thermococcus sp. JdF3]
MATYNMQSAFVKYYKESTDDYSIPIKFSVVNFKPYVLYVKVSIINPGNSGFTFSDSTTEKTFAVGSSTNNTFSSTVTPNNAVTETMRDDIALRVEYFKNSDYTGKLGEDTINYQLNYYIQNQDLSWTSSQYPNEDAVVFDVIPATQWGGTTSATGLKNNVRIVASGGKNYGTTTGIIEDIAVKLGQSAKACGYNSTSFTVRIIPYYTTGGTIKDKFVAGVVKVISLAGDTKYLEIRYSDGTTLATLSSTGKLKKFVFFPAPFNGEIYMYGYTKTDYSWCETVKVIAQLDGLIVFNPLP